MKRLVLTRPVLTSPDLTCDLDLTRPVLISPILTCHYQDYLKGVAMELVLANNYSINVILSWPGSSA